MQCIAQDTTVTSLQLEQYMTQERDWNALFNPNLILEGGDFFEIPFAYIVSATDHIHGAGMIQKGLLL